MTTSRGAKPQKCSRHIAGARNIFCAYWCVALWNVTFCGLVPPLAGRLSTWWSDCAGANEQRALKQSAALGLSSLPPSRRQCGPAAPRRPAAAESDDKLTAAATLLFPSAVRPTESAGKVLPAATCLGDFVKLVHLKKWTDSLCPIEVKVDKGILCQMELRFLHPRERHHAVGIAWLRPVINDLKVR